ncbi:MAG TPA: sulfurtransferase TusA family protein [Actinomycetota bacterium]|nr:sulfurtransferase TusA family protein [Actinomycetota bacterium]
MEARIADTIEAASVTRTVDARGQSCPGPLVTLHKALVDVPSGELVELLATDPGSISDVPAWAKISGNELVDLETAGPVFRYVVRKS